MAAPWRVFIVLVVLFTLVSLIGVEAQPTGRIIVESDLELLSIGDVSGGGRVKWTLTGEQAGLLRTEILAMFDENQSVPRGFAFQGEATGATIAPPNPTINNGVIDSAEADQYLAKVQNVLEGKFCGTLCVDFRLVQIKGVDKAEEDLPPEKSTQGLVGSIASTTANLEINFLFDVRSSAGNRRFPQADQAFANALHQVFGFDATEDLMVTGCPPYCYPFPARGGWRHVRWSPGFTAGGPFLWAGGNLTADPWNATGAYAPGWSNVTYYSTDGVALSSVDLRFATNASLSFDYTGGTDAASAGDVLLVQLSTDGTNWQNLTANGDPDGPSVNGLPLSVLGNATFDLDPWLGQSRVYLRLNFTANNDMNVDGPGFFVRNMRIEAPSVAEGGIDFRHVDYVVGFLSFSGDHSPNVRPHLIRTPVGEIQYYSAVYEAGALPGDTDHYATFDVLENPQVLFVLLVICWWTLGWLQDRSWERYRQMHPGAIRGGAVKSKWLHWTGRIFVILLILFYFFPTMLNVAGIVIGGLAFWVLAIGMAAGLGGFTTYWYRRKEALIPQPLPLGPGEKAPPTEAPPEPAPPPAPARLICAACDMDIGESEEAYTCECGQAYHPAHAAEKGTCVACGRNLAPEPPPEPHMLTVQCPTCGEVQVVEEEVDLAFAKCSGCGVILKDIQQGYNYLLIADQPNVAYEWFNSVVRKGIAGLCMSTTFPEKLKREYGLPEVELYWLSDTNPGPRTIDPKRLDFEIMRALSNFIKDNKGAAIVLDGLEYLIVENSFDRVLKFIKKVNDLASVHDVTMFVPISTTGLGPEEGTLLRKEFDKVEVVPAAPKESGGAEPPPP